MYYMALAVIGTPVCIVWLPASDLLRVSKKTWNYFVFLNNSVKHQPILIRFGVKLPENTFFEIV